MKQIDKIFIKSNCLIIGEDVSGQRIDNFLFNKIKNVPKSHVYKMLRQGEIRVNKKRVAPSYKIQIMDNIRIPPFWSETALVKNKPNSKLIRLLLNSIIFEDEKILAINKPAGIASHGGSGINFGAIEILREARPDLKNLELVHRLDRDTSGCLILAKKRSALRELHELIRKGQVLKKYLLLVCGCWKGGKRTVSAPLFKNQLKSGEYMVTINSQGKESITVFYPVKVGSVMSLLEAELKTGRTHQIRVHAAHIGYPIAGDEKYGDKEFNQEMKQRGLNRLFLHAEEVSFIWSSGVKVKLVARLDPQLEKTFNHI